MSIVVSQAQEAELAAATTQAGQHDTDEFDGDGHGGGRQGDKHHAGGGEGGEDEDADGVGDAVDEVGSDELGEEGGQDVGEQDDAFGEVADEVLGGGQDDDVEDIIDQAWTEGTVFSGRGLRGRIIGSSPNSQKATRTWVSGLLRMVAMRARQAGVPGIGRWSRDEDGDGFILLCSHDVKSVGSVYQGLMSVVSRRESSCVGVWV